jgi:hypothetical protein
MSHVRRAIHLRRHYRPASGSSISEGREGLRILTGHVLFTGQVTSGTLRFGEERSTVVAGCLPVPDAPVALAETTRHCSADSSFQFLEFRAIFDK